MANPAQRRSSALKLVELVRVGSPALFLDRESGRCRAGRDLQDSVDVFPHGRRDVDADTGDVDAGLANRAQGSDKHGPIISTVLMKA